LTKELQSEYIFIPSISSSGKAETRMRSFRSEIKRRKIKIKRSGIHQREGGALYECVCGLAQKKKKKKKKRKKR
jgi:hypothetical protein